MDRRVGKLLGVELNTKKYPTPSFIVIKLSDAQRRYVELAAEWDRKAPEVS